MNESRDHIVSLRLTDVEKARLASRAKAQGMSLSSYLRALLLGEGANNPTLPTYPSSVSPWRYPTTTGTFPTYPGGTVTWNVAS